MKYYLVVVLALAIAGFSTFSQAEQRFYAGGVWSDFDFQEQPFADSESLPAAGLMLGWRPIKFASIELRAGAGLDTLRVEYVDNAVSATETVELTAELDFYTSLLIRPTFDYQFFSIYALVGYSHLQFSGAANVDSVRLLAASETYNSLTYGGGIGFRWFDGAQISVEYQQLADDDFTVDGLNFVVQGNF